jgi:hypothetical protein
MLLFSYHRFYFPWYFSSWANGEPHHSGFKLLLLSSSSSLLMLLLLWFHAIFIYLYLYSNQGCSSHLGESLCHSLWHLPSTLTTPCKLVAVFKGTCKCSYRRWHSAQNQHSPDFLCCCPLDTGNWMRNCFDCSAVFSCNVFTGSCTEFCDKHFNIIILKFCVHFLFLCPSYTQPPWDDSSHSKSSSLYNFLNFPINSCTQHTTCRHCYIAYHDRT